MILKNLTFFTFLISIVSISQNDTLTSNLLEFKTISTVKLAYSKANDSLFSGYEKASLYSLYHYSNGILDEIYLSNDKKPEFRNFTKLNEDGVVIIKGKYHNNSKIGEWHFFDDDGTLNCIGSYFNNKKARKWKYYRNYKEHYRTEYYRDGKMLNSRFE